MAPLAQPGSFGAPLAEPRWACDCTAAMGRLFQFVGRMQFAPDETPPLEGENCALKPDSRSRVRREAHGW